MILRLQKPFMYFRNYFLDMSSLEHNNPKYGTLTIEKTTEQEGHFCLSPMPHGHENIPTYVTWKQVIRPSFQIVLPHGGQSGGGGREYHTDTGKIWTNRTCYSTPYPVYYSEIILLLSNHVSPWLSMYFIRLSIKIHSLSWVFWAIIFEGSLNKFMFFFH